jgi:hypothetical protein
MAIFNELLELSQGKHTLNHLGETSQIENLFGGFAGPERRSLADKLLKGLQ